MKILKNGSVQLSIDRFYLIESVRSFIQIMQQTVIAQILKYNLKYRNLTDAVLKKSINRSILFLKQVIFPWSVNRNSNWSPDKSIRIVIGTRTNQLESQSEHGQSMSRTIAARPVYEVNQHKVDGNTQVYYIICSCGNTRTLF